MQANKWKQPMNQNKPINTKINSDQEILKKKNLTFTRAYLSLSICDKIHSYTTYELLN